MKRLFFLVMMISFIFSLFSNTDWENPVNVYQSFNVDWNRCGVATDDGCMIYVWSDTHSGCRNIYAQKVNDAGNVVWTPPILIDSGRFTQKAPVITRTSNNEYIIAYTEYQNFGEGILKAQKINTYGQVLWASNGITLSPHRQSSTFYDIAADNQGGAYVAWMVDCDVNANIFGQRISSTGVISWGLSGLSIGSTNAYESGFSIVPDNNGGIFLATCKSGENLSWVSLSRIQSNGLVLWNRNMQNNSSRLFGFPSITTLSDNTVMMFWSGADLNGKYIKGQRFSIDGNMLWNNQVTVISDYNLNINAIQNMRIVKTSDDAVIITWQDDRSSLQNQAIFAQRIDINGNLSWQQNGVQVSAASGYLGEQRLTADASGGCYIVWDVVEEFMDYSRNIYAQNITSTGSAYWGNGGEFVTRNIYDQVNPMVRVINEKVIIGWEDQRSSSNSIYYQIFSYGGLSLLQSNGRQLFWSGANSPYRESLKVFPRPDGIAVVWAALRDFNSGDGIYYQYLNPGGEKMLEQYGRTVTDSSYFRASEYSAATTPEGKLGFVWRDNNGRTKLQVIDEYGNRLMGNNGIYITESTGSYQNNPKISYLDGAFYIGWEQGIEDVTSSGSRTLSRIYGQKLVNNQLMWGANGIPVSQPDSLYLNDNCELAEVAGSNFIWISYSYDMPTFGLTNIYAKALNPDGTTASGWADAGINTCSYYDIDYYRYFPQAKLTNNGLFIGWLEFRTDINAINLYGQMISPQGQLLWDPMGVNLSSSVNNVTDFGFLPGNDLVITWTERLDTKWDNYIQNFSTAGSPIWSDNPVNISPATFSFNNTNPKLARFDNGSIIAVWNHTPSTGYTNACLEDIYYRYITPQGVPVFHTWGRFLANNPDREFKQTVCMSDNAAYVVWLDSNRYKSVTSRFVDDEYETYSIYAQKLSNEYVANEDEYNTPAGINLAQNYPNPFNPVTKISFSLKQDSEATLIIYNQKGQKVKTLCSGTLDKGKHDFIWNGKDDNDKPVASGVYLYKLSSGNTYQAKKMVLLK